MRTKVLIMNRKNIKLLQGLSKEEKLDIVQMLWDDIASDPDSIAIPSEHIKIVKERLSFVEEGNASYRPWEEVKRKYISE